MSDSDEMSALGARCYFQVSAEVRDAVERFRDLLARTEGGRPSYQDACRRLVFAGAIAKGLIADPGVAP